MVSVNGNTLEHGTLKDIVAPNLNVLFVGYNPGMESARTGHHYASRSNRFWKLLYESGLTSFKLEAKDDQRLLEFGYGSTNIVSRPTRSAKEITHDEFKEGSKMLARLIEDLKPKIVCYVGIGVYRVFASHMLQIPQNRISVSVCIQERNIIKGVTDFVCSNPSGLNVIPYNQQLQCFITLKSLISNKHSG
ncbi:MAG: mismatch-specific DNA-glycosylase [Bacillota bacterium]